MLAVLVGTASAAVTDVALYRLGEDDPGFISNGYGPADANTVESLGGTDLLLIAAGDPNFASEVPGVGLSAVPATASTVSLDFLTDVVYTAGEGVIPAALAGRQANWGIEGWFKPEDNTSNGAGDAGGVYFACGHGGNAGFGIFGHGGFWKANIGGLSLLGSSAPLVIGEWVHVAIVALDAETRLYVNGVHVSTYGGLPNAPDNNATSTVMIGGQPDVTWATAGNYDHCRIFTFDSGAFVAADLNVASLKASVPDPSDGDASVAVDTTLSWTSGSEDLEAISQELVSVWEKGSGTPVVTNAVATSPYTLPGVLDEAVTYEWRVDTVYPTYGTVTGDVWEFATSLPITEPIQEGLQLHLDASDAATLTLDGSQNILAWTDKANAAVYVPGTYNGSDPNNLYDPNALDMTRAPKYDPIGCHQANPAVKFDGDNDWLFDIFVNQSQPLGIQSDLTLFIVASFDRPYTENGHLYTLANGLVSYGGAGYYKYLVKASGDWATDYVQMAGAYGNPANPDIPGDAFVATNWRSGSDMLARLTKTRNTVLATDVGSAGPIEWKWINSKVISMLGTQYLNDAPAAANNCSISEVLIYNRALTSAEVAAMENLLKNKWIVPYCGEPGQVYGEADINKDCIVDMGDLALLSEAWLTCGLIPVTECP